jgi:recombinational DNA repair protein RecR
MFADQDVVMFEENEIFEVDNHVIDDDLNPLEEANTINIEPVQVVNS